MVKRKTSALEKIESHEKLCRIMQKQTCQKIEELHQQINSIKTILVISAGSIIGGLFTIVLMLLQH